MVLDHPVPRGEMPPDVQVENRQFGDKALGSYSNNQEYEARQAHCPELQRADQFTHQACRVRRRFRHKDSQVCSCKLAARLSRSKLFASLRFTGTYARMPEVPDGRIAAQRKIPPPHAGYHPRFFVGRRGVLERPCNRFPRKQLFTCEYQWLWYRVCQRRCRMSAPCAANS